MGVAGLVSSLFRAILNTKEVLELIQDREQSRHNGLFSRLGCGLGDCCPSHSTRAASPALSPLGTRKPHRERNHLAIQGKNLKK